MTKIVTSSGLNIFTFENSTITITRTDSEYKTIYAHTSTVRCAHNEYFVDEQKNLHSIDNGDIKFICRLKRGVFSLSIHNDILYALDCFGDLHKIVNGECVFVFGTLSYPMALAFYDNLVFIADKYCRLRISDLNGHIHKFVFMREAVNELLIIGARLVCVGASQLALFSLEDFRLVMVTKLSSDCVFSKAVKNGENSFVVLSNNEAIEYSLCEDSFSRRVLDKTNGCADPEDYLPAVG